VVFGCEVASNTCAELLRDILTGGVFIGQLPLSAGDVLIMDNLGSHKRRTIRQAIRAVGAKLLFLPPYSPDLNPIEQVFAKLKTLLRKAGERTIEATWRRIGALLDEFRPDECANYLKKSRLCFSLTRTCSSPSQVDLGKPVWGC
jgi:transposase